MKHYSEKLNNNTKYWENQKLGKLNSKKLKIKETKNKLNQASYYQAVHFLVDCSLSTLRFSCVDQETFWARTNYYSISWSSCLQLSLYCIFRFWGFLRICLVYLSKLYINLSWNIGWILVRKSCYYTSLLHIVQKYQSYHF